MSVAVIGLKAPSVFEADLPAVAYEEAPSPDEAHRNLRKALEQGSIAMGPHGPEILSYDLVYTTLRDHRFGPPPGLGLETQGITSGPLWFASEHQPARHEWRRSHPAPPTCVEGVHAAVGSPTRHHDHGHHQRVDRPADGHGTLRDCQGHRSAVSGSGHQRAPGRSSQGLAPLSAWADDFFKLFTWNVAAYERDILTAWEELDGYIDDMVAYRRHSLTDDLISELIRAEDDGDRLSIEELRMLVAGILMAGTDTTRNQVAAAVDVFCDHPEQWELLAEEPELAMKAVEEVMRYSPVVFGVMRIATEDVELEGVIIPAGTFVMCNTAAANRDPSVFDEPDRLDITRKGAAPMQTFGAGAHYCLGANLARRELAEALRVMASRMRNLRHAGPSVWKPIVGITGPATLPVQFDAA